MQASLCSQIHSSAAAAAGRGFVVVDAETGCSPVLLGRSEVGRSSLAAAAAVVETPCSSAVVVVMCSPGTAAVVDAVVLPRIPAIGVRELRSSERVSGSARLCHSSVPCCTRCARCTAGGLSSPGGLSLQAWVQLDDLPVQEF